MINLREVAPQNVELNETNLSLANHCLNPNECFNFDIEFLDKFCKFMNDKSHISASVTDLVIMQKLCIISKYYRLPINELWINIFAPTGAGKSKAIGDIDDICLSKINDELREKSIEYFKTLSDEDKKNPKEFYQLQHDIEITTYEALIPTLNTIKVADINADEIEDILENKDKNALLTSLKKSHGRGSINAPTQKKNYNFTQGKISGISIYLTMSCTSSFLTKSNYLKHLSNGLFNRGITVLELKRRRNNTLSITKMEQEYFQNIFSEYCDFCEKFNDMRIEENFIETHQIYEDFERYVYDEMDKFQEPYDALFVRANHQFKAVCMALFYASEFQRYKDNPINYKPTNRIDSTILEKTRDFMLRYTAYYCQIATFSIENKVLDDNISKILETLKNKLSKSSDGVLLSQLGNDLRPKFIGNENSNKLKTMLEDYVVFNDNGKKIMSIKKNF